MTMSDIDIKKLLKVLPQLIRENDTVKGAIITALSGVVATRDDIRDLIREMDKRFDDLKKDVKNDIVELRKDVSVEIDSLKKDVKIDMIDLQKDIKRNSLEIATLSARSGDDVESMVRDLMNDVLVLHKVDISNIEKVDLIDEDGTIFTPGFTTHVDVVMSGGETLLYEIKFRADHNDAYHFLQVARLYEKIYERKPDRLVLLVLEINSASLRAITKFPVPIDVIAGSVVP
jgi:hypothetical protein